MFFPPSEGVMLIQNPVTLKDALYNLVPKSGASDEYCKGLIVGIVSSMMACGVSYKDAIAHLAIHLPLDPETRIAVPPSWEADVLAAMAACTPMRRS